MDSLWLRCVGPAGLGITPEFRPHPLQARALPPRGLVLGHGAQGQGEETLAPAGALTPAQTRGYNLDHRQDSLSQRSRVGASGLDSTARSPTPTRGCHFTLFKQEALENCVFKHEKVHIFLSGIHVTVTIIGKSRAIQKA